MSLPELKERAAELSADERLQLAAFLAELDQERTAEFHDLLDCRMKAMDAGQKVTMEDFEAEHARQLRRK
jgi:hypothetical protein